MQNLGGCHGRSKYAKAIHREADRSARLVTFAGIQLVQVRIEKMILLYSSHDLLDWVDWLKAWELQEAEA